MADGNKDRRRTLRIPAWAPYLVLILSLLFTVAVTYSAADAADHKERVRFEATAQRVNGAISGRLDTYVAMLVSGAGLLTARQDVSRDDFRAFVQRLDLQARYPGIQGIGFSIRVPPEERDSLVARVRAEGIADFTIRPPEPRDEYTTILYLEPLDRRNRAALGYDMFSEPVRRAAMERARDTNAPAASGRVMLVQEIDEQKQRGFLIYVPVYQNGMPHTTPAERQAALRGYVYSPFRADDLLHGIMGGENIPALEVKVYDGTETTPDHLLHDSAGRGGGDERKGRRRSVSTLDIAGRPWTVVVTAPVQFDPLSGRDVVPYFFVGGALGSLLLFGITRTQARAQQIAERAAADLERSEQSMRESAQHLRNVLDGVTTHTGLMRPDGTLIEVNRAMLGAASLEPAAVLGKTFEDTYFWSYSEDSRKAVKSAIERARTGEVARVDVRMRVAEDRFTTVDLTIAPLRGESGTIEHLVPTGMDISARLQAEQERASLSEEIIRMQAARLAELSTPLIPLHDRILLMPLIGTMDAQRAQQVLETVAVGVTNRQARAAIIDITGVPTVDTQVASVLLQTAQVIRLLGAEVVLTGINPAVAQTIVRMGIDLGDIVTRGDLASGIGYATARIRERGERLR
ncbi:CHASE domain-containing protein [Polyangium aurulentum]|uniref:CHASE domain-containing protein n=1 Tax=Polyangium aurulentum TaxID=2567896 RepID=UPI00146E592A|nr:CHASE domain-containing protein [Polyangium aurulentum]UQA59778.1 CHASE domain-containing protein [Polyangium aurulentum]